MSAKFSKNIEPDTIDQSWALQLHNECLDLCSKIFRNGMRVIQDIDPEEEFNRKQVQALSKCLKTKLKDVEEHLETMYQHHLDKIGTLLDKVVILEKKLEITPSIQEEDFTTKPLVEFEATLKTTLEEYQKKIDEQNKILAELQKKHSFYSYKLGKSPKRLSILPGKTAIEEFRSQIEKLENEFTSRHERYNRIKKNIIKIDEESNIVPQQKLAEDCDASSVVSEEMMMKIENLYQETIRLRAELHEEIEKLNRELEKLWKLLDVPTEQQRHFLNTLDGYSKTSQQKLKSEIESLMKIRAAKLPEIIEKQKTQLQDLWERCHVDSGTKHSFPFIYNTECSEELYNNYHDEIDKWEQYYEKHRDILEQLEEYKKLGNSLLEMNLNAGGIKFYENRGGVLLSIMKKKKLITSRLTTAKKNLLAMSKNYLKNNNKPFLTCGMTIEDFLTTEKKRQELPQKTQPDRTKLTVPRKSHLMKTPVRHSSKQHTFKIPSSVDSRPANTQSRTKTPTLPKFKLNQSKTRTSPPTSQWKPSSVQTAVQTKSDGEQSWTDYSDFEEEVKKYSSRSTSVSGGKIKN